MRSETDGVSISTFGDCRGVPMVVLNTIGDEGQEVYDAVRSLTDRPFSLVCVRAVSWNDSLSPWKAPAVFGDEAFGGFADERLEWMTGTLLPSFEVEGSGPSRRIVAGYSLAGLFSLYSIYRTDVFDAVVSASGSMWFPGFIEMMETEELARRPECVYLSLGDRESRTKNPVMSTVQSCTERAAEILASKGVKTMFELNPGNHFKDTALRTAKGIAWTLERV